MRPKNFSVWASFHNEALPGVLGIQGEGLFIFRDLGRRVILFSGIWGESITFWGFREQGAEEKHFRELGRKVIFLSGSREQRPPWGGSAIYTQNTLFLVPSQYKLELEPSK